VPELAVGAAPELHELRAASADALKTVLHAWEDGCDDVLVGGGAERATFQPGAVGTFAGFGLPVTTALPGPGGDAAASDSARLPLSLTVGAWLMNHVAPWDDAGGTVRAESVPVDIAPGDAVEVGQEIAASAQRVALLVMGDGSSALSLKAPGYLVPGAPEWQDDVTAALAAADVDLLAAISPDDAARMGAMGRAAWQVLAGAAGASDGWHAELLAQDDRYGVAYLVARWTRQGRDA
ncbi:MAG: hypothetical protein ACJ73L_03515, partial [Actinomycetes bacterium]